MHWFTNTKADLYKLEKEKKMRKMWEKREGKVKGTSKLEGKNKRIKGKVVAKGAWAVYWYYSMGEILFSGEGDLFSDRCVEYSTTCNIIAMLEN
jgi:hypothetical protein